MGRETKRVPLDFDWPLKKTWKGFLSPDTLDGLTCAACDGSGYSPYARHLKDLWYGYAPFRPEDNGSVPLTPETPAVRAFAERNVKNAPGYYGRGEDSVVREAGRLCDLWNGMWSHHVSTDDVAALVDAERLMDFTHRWTRGEGWQQLDPPVTPTVEDVNSWAIGSMMGHDAINAGVVWQARCEREGYTDTCEVCGGHGSVEVYPGQRADADAWEQEEPPTGDGWQLWETVSEGSPISPVFPDAEGLAQWLTTPASCWGATSRPMTISQASAFVGAGWAPSFVGNAGGIHHGDEFVGSEMVLRGFEDDQ